MKYQSSDQKLKLLNSATAGNISTSSCGDGNKSAVESNLTPAEKAKAN